MSQQLRAKKKSAHRSTVYVSIIYIFQLITCLYNIHTYIYICIYIYIYIYTYIIFYNNNNNNNNNLYNNYETLFRHRGKTIYLPTPIQTITKA